MLLFFCMWVIYRIFFYHCYNGDLCLFILCLFLVIISEIGIIVCDYIIIDISFILCVVLGYGYIILVIWGLLNYLYHRTGIYLFDFFFVCVFGILIYVIILSLFYDHCFGMSVRDSFIILEV